MEKKHHSFPSIEQFRHIVQQVQYRTHFIGNDDQGNPLFNTELPLPKLTFRGTVKLHGTNAGIIYTWNPEKFMYEFHAQSRTNIITPTSDNAGFAAFAHTINTEMLLSQVMKAVPNLGYTPEVVKIYGEWCGGNIQKGVALNGLEKMFVIFAIKIDEMWLDDNSLSNIKIPESRVYNILDYPTYDIEIDFNNPKEAADKLAEFTTAVEKECPVGKAFGKVGVGEGIVYHCITKGWEGSRYWFKIKGDDHKVSKTKEKVPVNIERVNSMNELIENFLTEARLFQGISYLKENGLELSQKSTGSYLKWIYEDIIKEELDTIMGNGFEPKEISGPISNKARKWFFEKLNESVGL